MKKEQKEKYGKLMSKKKNVALECLLKAGKLSFIICDFML